MTVPVKTKSEPAAAKPPQVAAMSLAEKLLRIEEDMPDIPKTGKNEALDFTFREAESVVNAVRPLLVKYGVKVIPTMTDHKIHNKESWNAKANMVTERGVKIVVTFVFKFINTQDPADTLDIPWVAEGDDFGDKGTNKAATIAQKFLYMKLFNIGDEDPDAVTPEGGSVAAPGKAITPAKEAMIYRMLKRLGQTVEAYEEALKKPVAKMTNQEADNAIQRMQAAIERQLASEVEVA